MKTTCFLAVTLLFLAPISQAQNLSPRLTQALSVLPPDSETVAVEQTAHLMVAQGKSQGEGHHALLSNLQFATVAPYLGGRTIELSLEGRSRFRAPKSLGLMPYDGCGLLYLKPLNGETRASLEGRLLRSSKRITSIDGQRVGVFEEKKMDDLWHIYVAVPQDNLVVLATDKNSLETTLARLKEVEKLHDCAIPPEWSDWKWVDTHASFWAVRRLDLPESTGIHPGKQKDEKAKSCIVFSHGSAKKPSFVMRYDGDPKIARDLFTSISRELAGKLEVIPDSSVTQFSVPNGNNGYFVFYALGFLGTGIFL